MKKNKLFFVFMFLIFIVLFNIFNNDNTGFKDDYYYFVNKEVFAKKKLESNEYSWSYFMDAQEDVDKDTNLLVEDVLDDNEVINNIYNKALNVDKRNKDGIKPLEPYLNKVWNVSTIKELGDIIVEIENNLGVEIITNIEVMPDYQNNDKNIIYFYPVTYAFGSDSDYMINADYMTYKAYIRRACVQLWKAYGLDAIEARNVVERVFNFYENISSNSKLANELEDITSYYNVVSFNEVDEIFSNIDNYLARRGVADEDMYSLVDKEQYQYLNDSLNIDNLEVWKEVIITKILSSYANYGTDDYVEVVDNLNESLLGKSDNVTKDDKAKNLVKSLFSDEIDELYVRNNLTDDRIQEIEEMFLEIKDVYKDRLKKNKWLSKKAKAKALAKLDNMKIIIGIDENNSFYNISKNLKVSNDSLISDVIRIQQIIMKNDLGRLDNDDKINLVSQIQVNAYYQPLDNSIIIPVAFFELVDDNHSYYEKLGTLGMILSHEVTHAFDDNGSKFDENGNLNDWWSKDDKKTFEKLKQEVIDYYNTLEVIDGKYINGEKTVNENIADLGAIACIVEIADKRNASNDEIKDMFESFARIWASVENEDYMELLLLQDVHAPNKFRVNAVLSNIDEFYQVYNVYPWDKMWIDKNNRIVIW